MEYNAKGSIIKIKWVYSISLYIYIYIYIGHILPYIVINLYSIPYVLSLFEQNALTIIKWIQGPKKT
jgi:hypothetical protein